MSEERLNEIRETVKSIVFLSDVNGGFTSQNIKFVELWNYTMELQEAKAQGFPINLEGSEKYDINYISKYTISSFLPSS